MLLILAPSKGQNFDGPVPKVQLTLPALLEHTKELAALLKQMSPDELMQLMKIRSPLAKTTQQRFADFHLPFTQDNARPAILTFTGTMYEAIDFASLQARGYRYLQEHLRILSGFYGCLRPFDLMQPYRLEMQTRLSTDRGDTLYRFWGPLITEELNTALSSLRTPLLVNLASTEYFRAIIGKQLNAPVLRITFKEVDARGARVVAMYSKRARGLMARFAVEEQLKDPQGLKDFTSGGYRFSPKLSTEGEWVFTRPRS
ncbi:MAG: peroxide stress protein YaaA [Desulfobulbus propionicus]|nr:MAG: peroxide stress protein YaaA [Desulfobulbus propionicus]